MKNFFSKNRMIGISVTLNLALCGYFFAAKINSESAEPKMETKKVSKRNPTPKTASVTGVGKMIDGDRLQLCYNSLIERSPQVNNGSVRLQFTVNPRR